MGKGGYNGGSTVIHGGSNWFGRGSVTSQPAEAKKTEPKLQSSQKREKKKPKQDYPNTKGNGLTIPEQIKAAERKAGRLASEIAQTERRLKELRSHLASAKDEIERAKNLPRRTVMGVALQKAEKKKPSKNRSSEQLQRDAAKAAQKEVAIEIRVGGRLKARRIGLGDK